MEVLVAKLGWRLPGLLARAMVGDATAIAQLVAAGGVAALAAIADNSKKHAGH